jgi:hypothetical protein
MTDRKLPVIYVRTTTDKSSILTNPDDEIELVDPPFLRALDAAVEGCTVVPYEPAVPRCKTCNRWGTNHRGEHACTNPLGIDCAPRDGSGYCCHHVGHSELRKP